MEPIGVVIADDHPLIRKLFADVIDEYINIKFMKEAGDGADLLTIVEATHPDLAVIDLEMPKVNGYDAIFEISNRFPQVKTIAFSGFLTFDTQKRVIELGVHSSISKTEPPLAIRNAIKEIVKGKNYHSDISSKKENDIGNQEKTDLLADKTAMLTKREKQILQQIQHGHSSKEIACFYNISPLTVNKHRQNIKKKLGARNTAEMIRIALE